MNTSGGRAESRLSRTPSSESGLGAGSRASPDAFYGAGLDARTLVMWNACAEQSRGVLHYQANLFTT